MDFKQPAPFMIRRTIKAEQASTTSALSDKSAKRSLDYKESLNVGSSQQSILLQNFAPITHAEITEKVKEGGRLRGTILEAQDDSRQPRYAVFILSNWRKGYCVLHVHWPARPRLYVDLDRLLVLIRFEYGYTGTIALKRASDAPDGKRYWRVTL